MMKKANLLKMVHLAKGLEKFSDNSSKAPQERDEYLTLAGEGLVRIHQL